MKLRRALKTYRNRTRTIIVRESLAILKCSEIKPAKNTYGIRSLKKTFRNCTRTETF